MPPLLCKASSDFEAFDTTYILQNHIYIFIFSYFFILPPIWYLLYDTSDIPTLIP